MTTLGLHSRLREVMDEPRARAALAEAIPLSQAVLDRSEEVMDHVVSVWLAREGASPAATERLRTQLAEITRPGPARAPAIEPRADYDDMSGAPPVQFDVPVEGSVFSLVEVQIEGPSCGNPFVDVEVWAQIGVDGGVTRRVGGFYDGDGRYLIRFLPDQPGRWTVTTGSTAGSLAGHTGSVTVAPSDEHGPVKVTGQFDFAYTNGEPYVPIGTTAYAWTHQGDELAEKTLRTLGASSFNKVRMGIFPKHMPYNHNDPERYPFVLQDGRIDPTTFDPAYWRQLELRLEQLAGLGVEADLILFHPYDRWGFSDLGPDVDERYLRYVVRRLAAFPNVWWSLANEYDFVSSKDLDDWQRIAAILTQEDHVGHLTSIHNGFQLFDYSADWATHCSIQRLDGYRTTEAVSEWRRRWGKPVIIDEPGYEGDLEWEWGNLPAAELVRRFWDAMIRGGYATHGETYWNDREEVFWAKGGELVGQSPSRIAFLAQLVAESPTKRLEPIRTWPDGNSAGVPGAYEIHYLGLNQPRELAVEVWPDTEAAIDVIDTWAMTVETLPGRHTGSQRISLPARPYLAVRVRRVDDDYLTSRSAPQQ